MNIERVEKQSTKQLQAHLKPFLEYLELYILKKINDKNFIYENIVSNVNRVISESRINKIINKIARNIQQDIGYFSFLDFEQVVGEGVNFKKNNEKNIIKDFVSQLKANVEQIKISLINNLYVSITAYREDIIAKNGAKLEIRQAFKSFEARNRNLLISKVNEYYSHLNQKRSEEIGIDSYRWITKKDGKQRELHNKRHNKIFKWSDKLSDGHAGRPYNCRCVAMPVIFKGLANA